MIDKEQELLARVLDLFAQRFDKKAILRGGMVLRVLGSPRFTNDLDYFTGNTPSEFYDFLRSHVAKLTDNDIKQELMDYLPQEEITGLAMMFRAALAKLR